MWTILLFFATQLVNVILSTIKSVIMIKGGKGTACVINAVSYGFNTIVVKAITEVDLFTAVLITIVSNLIGAWIGLTIAEKMRKEQLWKITVTVPTENLHDFKVRLNENNIGFIAYETSYDKYKVVDIFSKCKLESKIVKNIFKEFKVKYTITANSATL